MIFYKFIIYNKNIRFDKKVKFEEFDSFIKMLKTPPRVRPTIISL